MKTRKHPYIGRWAVCGAGKLGQIEQVEEHVNRVSYKGRAVDGSVWQSFSPKLINAEHSKQLSAAFAQIALP